MATFIEVSGGHKAVVDSEDADMLRKYRWYFHNGYARTKTSKNEGQKAVLMHRMIMSPKEIEVVDHKNGNGLDNRKSNLRICDVSENKANGGKYKNNISGFRGVFLKKGRKKKWGSLISFKGNKYFLGYFYRKHKAHEAYSRKAEELFGEFMYNN